MIVKTIASRICASLMVAFAGLAALTAPAPATAGSPVAIVEDVEAGGAGVGFMEYLEAGRTIRLGKNGRIVIGYLRTCLRETISGGTVTVGAGQSKSAGGTIQRERVECDGGQMKLTEAQAGKSGVVVMRNVPKGDAAGGFAAPAPEFRIYSTRPIITLAKPGSRITITRLDKPAPEIIIGTTGRFVDLAQAKEGLAIGGLYRADAGGISAVFSVDAFATDGVGAKAGPAIGRLIRL